jgi:hypothetical protein
MTDADFMSASNIPDKRVREDIDAIKARMAELEQSLKQPGTSIIEAVTGAAALAHGKFSISKLEELLKWRERTGNHVPSPDEEEGQSHYDF